MRLTHIFAVCYLTSLDFLCFVFVFFGFCRLIHLYQHVYSCGGGCLKRNTLVAESRVFFYCCPQTGTTTFSKHGGWCEWQDEDQKDSSSFHPTRGSDGLRVSFNTSPPYGSIKVGKAQVPQPNRRILLSMQYFFVVFSSFLSIWLSL